MEHATIIPLENNLFRIVPDAGYRLYNFFTGRYHSEVETRNVSQWRALPDGSPQPQPHERANYILTLQGAQRLGVENVTFLGQTIPVALALQMLDAVNLYAMQCVAVTEAHRAAINALTTIAEVDNYDFTGGYPEKLQF